MSSTAPVHPATTPRRRRRGLVAVRRALGLAVLLLVVLTAWAGIRGYLAKKHLERAQTLAPRLMQDVRATVLADPTRARPRAAGSTARNAPATRARVAELQRETGQARRLTGDLGWSLMMHLPVVGDDLGAGRASAAAVDRVAVDALPSLLQVGSVLQPARLRPVKSRLDLAPFQRAAAPLRRADDAVHDARALLAPYRTAEANEALLPPLARAVRTLDGALAPVAQQSATARRTVDLLPPMLGAQGRRRYLVLFQNLARRRSLGGTVGAVAVVEADRGTVRLTKSSSATEVAAFAEPVAQLQGAALHQQRPARRLADVTRAPDFPTSGALAATMWQRRFRQPVDGVLSVDPVVLSSLLRLTGPFTLHSSTTQPGQRPTAAQLARLGPFAAQYVREHSGPVTVEADTTVNAATVLRLLLHDVYTKGPVARAGAGSTVPDRTADQLTAAIAGTTWTKVVAGRTDPAGTLAALADGARQGRVLLWSAHGAEQARLAGTVLQGRLPRTESGRPVVAVRVNDLTGSRTGWYSRTAVTAAASCPSSGPRRTQLSVTLRSTAGPGDLNDVLRGPRVPGLAASSTRSVLDLVGPVGGSVSRVVVGGRAVRTAPVTVAGRPVVQVALDVPAGGSVRVTATTSGPNLAGRTRLVVTPGVGDTAAVADAVECA